MRAGLEAGDFSILCPDDDVDRPLGERRILWAAGAVAETRPALSGIQIMRRSSPPSSDAAEP